MMTIRWWCTYPQNDYDEDSLLQAHIQLDESESRREEVRFGPCLTILIFLHISYQVEPLLTVF